MNNNNMIKGPVLKSLLLFALPIMVSNIFQQLYNTVDTIIVGNYLGEMSLAAIGASLAVYQLLVGFALGFGNGFGIVVARIYGRGDQEALKKSVASSLTIGFGVVILVMMIATVCLRPLLVALRTPIEIVDMAYDYIHIITMSVGIMFTYNLCSGLLRAIGNSIVPLLILILSSVLNIGLDLLFVVYLGTGIQGAAIATVLAQSVSVLVLIIYIWNKVGILVPSWHHFKPDQHMLRDLLGQGLSMALMWSIVIVGTVILQYAINDMGYLTIAGHTTARRFQSLSILPNFSLVIALATFVSQNKGANQGTRIILAVRYSYRLVVVWSLFICLMIYLFSEAIVMVLSGSRDETLVGVASAYLMFNALFYGLLGVLLTTRYSLQGLGEKVKPLMSSVIELLLKVVFVIMIIPVMGYKGVIISEPIIWFFMTAHLLYVYNGHPYIKSARGELRQLADQSN